MLTFQSWHNNLGKFCRKKSHQDVDSGAFWLYIQTSLSVKPGADLAVVLDEDLWVTGFAQQSLQDKKKHFISFFMIYDYYLPSLLTELGLGIFKSKMFHGESIFNVQ